VEHTGVVVETNGKEARVSLSGAEECSTCGCCGASGGLGNTPDILVDNRIQAEAGCQVIVEFDPGQAMKSGAVVFLAPIAALLVGALAGNSLGGTETAALLGALGALGLSVLAIAVYDRWLRTRSPVRPRIIRILPAQAEGKHCDSGVVQELFRRQLH